VEVWTDRTEGGTEPYWILSSFAGLPDTGIVCCISPFRIRLLEANSMVQNDVGGCQLIFSTIPVV
jgi:hypothetical protein